MNTLIIMYNLAKGQNETDFETWLREVAINSAAKEKR